jgi:hypothetical protein
MHSLCGTSAFSSHIDAARIRGSRSGGQKALAPGWKENRMDKVLEEIKTTLTDWKIQRTWGCLEIEVHDGEVVLIRQETKKKFNGGVYNGPARRETR